MSACETAGKWSGAIALLAKLGSDKIAMDTITCNTALSACEKT